MTMVTEIGIIIVAFNRPKHLNRLIASLKQNDCFSDFGFACVGWAS